LSLSTTPSQTVGPFFSLGLCFDGSPTAVAGDLAGAVRIAGTVYDGAGAPVADALVESWQADPQGRFADLHDHGGPSRIAGFGGFARCASAADGGFAIRTLKPGPLPGPDGATQAPHVDVSVFARGLLHRCVTRIYFADEQSANAVDPVLGAVPPERRDTLLAKPLDGGGYRFDIHLQGQGETVFFAL
jgi:protocatechuate 3,4-dioxygenase, alpha subunit